MLRKHLKSLSICLAASILQIYLAGRARMSSQFFAALLARLASGRPHLQKLFISATNFNVPACPGAGFSCSVAYSNHSIPYLREIALCFASSMLPSCSAASSSSKNFSIPPGIARARIRSGVFNGL